METVSGLVANCYVYLHIIIIKFGALKKCFPLLEN